jgi:hypothetical protein
MILNIPKGVNEVDKVEEEEEWANLEEEAITALTGQPNKANGSTCSTYSSNPRPKFDKLKVKCYRCKKQLVIMLGIVGIQLRGLKGMSIL